MEQRTPRQKERGYINPVDVVQVWKKLEAEFGLASLGRVRDYYKRKGLRNPSTGKPPSRQGIMHALKQTPEGRMIIVRASHSRYLDRPATGWPEEHWTNIDAKT